MPLKQSARCSTTANTGCGGRIIIWNHSAPPAVLPPPLLLFPDSSGCHSLHRICALTQLNCLRRTLLELAQSCPELHTLYVQRCAKLTDAGVAAVAQNGKLRSLCVAHVPDVGPLACAALTRSCTDSLESLDISWCRAVSDNMLGALADACFRLASVTAWGCSQISDRFLLGHRNDVLVEVLGPVEAPLASAPVAV